MKQAIDYTAYEQDFIGSLKSARHWFTIKRVIFIVLSICTMGLLILAGLWQIIPLILWLILFYLIYRAITDKKDTWTDFAAANNWQVTVPVADDVPPAIRAIGESPHTSSVIIADLNGKTGRLYTYEYTYGMGDMQTIHNFTILRVELPKAFPHIVLDSQKNADGVRRLFKGYQKISLESNFNQHFRIYIHDDEQVDVLSILTPDVMSRLIDDVGSLDIEIAGTSIYFIAIDTGKKVADIKNLLEATSETLNELFHRAATLKYATAIVPKHIDLASRPFVPLTLTRQSKTLIIIGVILCSTLVGLMIILARHTIKGMGP